MAKTIITALRDEIRYPIKAGFFENRLIERGLTESDNFDMDVAKSDPYRGAVADCIVGMLLSPDITEGDMRISQTEKGIMLKRANSIYLSIGEDPVDIGDKPCVYIES